MALSSLIHKAASPSVVPVALRAISAFAGQLHVSSSISTALNAAEHRQHVLFSGSHFAQSHQFSTVVVAKKLIDTSLLKVLQSEIKNAQNSGFEQKVPITPASFPFTLQENPGERTITLTREFSDETIEVMVKMPELFEPTEKFCGISSDESDSSSDDDSDIDSADSSSDNDSDIDSADSSSDNGSSKEKSDEVKEEAAAPSIPMTVTIERKGQDLKFEILCSADRITVQNMSNLDEDSVEFTGPKFDNLGPDMRRALLKYLEIRGIKYSLASFLYKFMANKSQREDLVWMKKLKKFVKEAKPSKK